MPARKDQLFAKLRHENTDYIPWIPFAGVHSGILKGHTATELLTDADKLFESLLEVNKLYEPDGQPIVFDLQIEAEILGCDLRWADKAPPSVASHPLENELTVPSTYPQKEDGRLPMVLDVTKRMKQAVGDTTALYGLICGPFTLASHLRGTEIFIDMFDNPDGLRDLLQYTKDVCIKMSEYYIEAGIDVVAVVDPLVSQISPRHFDNFLSSVFTEVFDYVRDQEVFSAFFVCGDATKNLTLMCQTQPDSIAIDENIDIVAAKAIADEHNVTLCGNIPLTTVMLMGNQQDNIKFTLDLLDSVDHNNLIIAPGCDMPYDVPVENVVGIAQAIHQPDEARQIVANYQAEDQFDIQVEIPDYTNLDHPLVEVFTLNSETCAACTYMFNAAMRAKVKLGESLDIVEYKFTERENVARCKEMGVEKLPSIYINGELAYSSVIPNADELLEKIAEYSK